MRVAVVMMMDMSAKEHFTNGRTFGLGTGLTLITAAFGAQASGWQHWITVGFLYGAGTQCSLFFAVLIAQAYFTATKHPEQVEGSLTNSRPQVSPHDEKSDRPLPPPDFGRRPSLKIAGAKLTTLSFTFPRKWIRDQYGDDTVTVPILNQAAPVGQTGVMVKSLVASLDFETVKGEVRHHVARAYWLDRAGNEINLDCGGTAAVVIGALRQPYTWTTYDNPHPPVPALPRFRSGSSLPQPSEYSFPFSEAMRVTVNLITADDGKTIEAFHFLLEVSDDGKRVEIGSYR